MYRRYHNRGLDRHERRAFDFPDEQDQVDGVFNLWLENDLDGEFEGWRVAFRLFPHQGQMAVSEIRILPADEWRGRQAGEWRADVLGFVGAVQPPERPGGSFPNIGPGVPSQVLRHLRLRELRRYAEEFRELLGDQVIVETSADGKLTYTYKDGPLGPAQEVAKMVIGARRWNEGDAVEGFRPTSAKQHPSARTDQELAAIAAAYAERVDALSRSPNKDVANRFELTPSKVRDVIYTAKLRGIKHPPPKKGEAGGGLTIYGQQCLREYQEANRASRRTKKQRKP